MVRLKYLQELYNFIATVDTPTRETHMTAPLIDNIFTNLRNYNFEAANKGTGTSDHKCQIVHGNINGISHRNKNTEYKVIRIHSDVNVKLFGNLLD